MKKMENVDAELTKTLEISLNGNKKLRGEVEALKRSRVEGASGGEGVKAGEGGNVQLVEQSKIETELPAPTAITPPPPTTTTTSSISFQMIPSPSTSIPKYTGYTFWSSDFHISPIADLKDIFQHFQMEIIDQSLSGHCKIMKPITCEKGLKVLNKNNGIELDTRKKNGCPNDIKRNFFNEYANDATFKNVDAFLCHHAMGLCEVFMGFGRPVVAVASTRYEIGRYGSTEWKEWNKNLVDIAANPRNVVAANNRFDAEYVKYFTGIKDVPVIPNYCGYTGATYNPTRPEWLIGPGRGITPKLEEQLQQSSSSSSKTFKKIRDLYPHFEYTDLASHPAIVLIPYQVSIMSIFEYYRMSIPLFVPSPSLLAEWQIKYRVLSELTWDMVFSKPKSKSNIGQYEKGKVQYDPNDMFSQEGIEYWVRFGDFYQWPHITTFDSFEELMTLIETVDLQTISSKMKEENERMKVELLETWEKIFHKMFEDVKPAKTQGGRPFPNSWEDGMRETYQIEPGRCGLGDDVHNMDISFVLAE